MQANEIMVWLLMSCVLVAVFAGAPVWRRLMRQRFSSVGVGNLSLILGVLVSLATMGGLRAVAQETDASASGEAAEATAETPAPPAVDTPATPASDAQPPSSAGSGSAAPLQVPLEAPDGAGPPVVFSEKRPEWVESKPVLDGDVHSLAVKSDFHARQADCWRALDQELVQGTKAYIAEYLGSTHAPMFFSLSLDEIKARFLRSDNVYHEVVEVSFGPMHQVHALLEFPTDFRQHLDTRWAQVVAAGRLVKTVGTALGILFLVTIVFGYFRLDTATRGYYTRRLQFVAAAAILALVVAGVVFARSSMTWVQWLLM